jgi:primosomal protein N'
MKVYKVSPVVKYSPFFDLTYVSNFDLALGDIAEVNFNNKKIKAIVLEKYSLKEAKVEIRKAQFKTKKIESKGEKVFSATQHSALKKFSNEFAIPLGEILFYLFGEELDTSKNVFSKMYKFSEEGVVIGDFDFQKYLLLTNPHISRLHLLFIYLEHFQKPKKVFIENNFLGVSETVFLEDLKKKSFLKNKLVFRGDNYTPKKKYFVKVVSGEIINQEVLEKMEGKKTFVFVLSLGYADRIYCADCKKPYACENCPGEYSIYIEDGEHALFCKSCKHKKLLKPDQYVICKNCGGWRMFSYGLGIDRVKEFLKEKNLDSKNILVGGLKELEKVKKKEEVFDMVVVASLGPLIAGGNFDTDERLIKLLSKLETIGNAIYINKRGDDALSLDNYKDRNKFLKEEILLRKKLKLPPYRKVLSLVFNYRNKKIIDKFLYSNFEKLKIEGEKKRGSSITYFWFVDSNQSELVLQISKALRNYGDLVVADSIFDFQIKR